MDVEASIKAGHLQEAWQTLAGLIRAEPGRADLRRSAFRLLAVRGEWKRAAEQLDVAARCAQGPASMLDQVQRRLLACEALRREVFAGSRTPVVLGEPAPWVALLVQALVPAAQGRWAEARSLRERALAEAPASRGSMDGTPFAWIADADSRLGPVLEAVVEGGYCWIPFDRLRALSVDPPQGLADLVWATARLTLATGGEVGAAIPVRYPGSETAGDALALARRTEWTDRGDGCWTGLGQRMLSTDAGDRSILEVRSLVLAPATE